MDGAESESTLAVRSISTDEASLTDPSSNPVMQHTHLVLGEVWWWSTHLTLTTIAIFANFLFILTLIYNRHHHDLKTFVSWVIATIAILDIIDVIRVIPILVEDVFSFSVFRHIFCSFGVFHELSVAIFLVSLATYVCVQAGESGKYYTRSSDVRNSRSLLIAKRVLIPAVIVVSLCVAVPFFLFPYSEMSHTCIDPFQVATFMRDTYMERSGANTNSTTNSTLKEGGVKDSETFAYDVYATCVTLFTYVLPMLVMPIAICVSCMRTCFRGRECCVKRHKQWLGEVLLVIIVCGFYLVTVVAVVLPKIDKMFQIKTLSISQAPLLWELANDAIRPLIYFMVNPAIWEGLGNLCCYLTRTVGYRKNNEHSPRDEEDEVEDIPSEEEDRLNDPNDKDESVGETGSNGATTTTSNESSLSTAPIEIDKKSSKKSRLFWFHKKEKCAEMKPIIDTSINSASIVKKTTSTTDLNDNDVDLTLKTTVADDTIDEESKEVND